MTNVSIEVDPELTAVQLWDFYVRNHICETGFGKDVAARILDHPHVIVAALDGDELVGLARAMFDGLSAHVMEFSLDLRLQGETTHLNGSLIEADPNGSRSSTWRSLALDASRTRMHVRHELHRHCMRGAVLFEHRVPRERRALGVLHRRAALRRRKLNRSR
jgi:hypothetical protein